MEHLVNVRFRPNGTVYTYRTEDNVLVGDKIKVYSWVNKKNLNLIVEGIKPMDPSKYYAYARKARHDED